MTDASDATQPSRFQRPMTWFIIGMVVIALPLSVWELMRFGPYRDIPLLMILTLGPGFMITAWPISLSQMIGFPLAALTNGAIYGGLAWVVPKIPFLWVRVLVVILPFMPVWAILVYHEFLSPDLTG